MENHHESGMQYTEVCQNEEKLCIVVSKEEDGYEYRYDTLHGGREQTLNS